MEDLYCLLEELVPLALSLHGLVFVGSINQRAHTRNEELKIHSCSCMSVSGNLSLTPCEICGVLLFVVLYVLHIIYLQSSGL
ncbi:hypothetical protein VNO80_21384 [Phaseolus coccineus]|uniref:Uncharacterized protein n=1 Tax=Phaseolus coccineus TaxID=3886 RepID=A0AAN9M2Z9_PHACN